MKEFTKEEIEMLAHEFSELILSTPLTPYDMAFLQTRLDLETSTQERNQAVQSLGDMGRQLGKAQADLESARKDRDELRAELTLIADQDDIEMVLDPTWAKRIASQVVYGRSISRIEQSKKEQEHG